MDVVEDEAPSKRTAFLNTIKQQANFYRIHLVTFTILPLIAAGIFYASNGETHIDFPDALFMCVSAMTVTGLATVVLSTLTRWQQVILFLLMSIGSTCSVSIITILVRKHYFRARFAEMVETDPEARQRCEDIEALEERKHPMHPTHLWDKMLHHGLPQRKKGESTPNDTTRTSKRSFKKKKRRGPLTADMVRRVDKPKEFEGKPPELMMEKQVDVDPADFEDSKLRSSSETEGASSKPDATKSESTEEAQPATLQRVDSPTPMSENEEAHVEPARATGRPHTRISDPTPDRSRRMSDPVAARRSTDREKRFKRIRTADPMTRSTGVPHTQTIEFADQGNRGDLRRRTFAANYTNHAREHSGGHELTRKGSGPGIRHSSTHTSGFPRSATNRGPGTKAMTTGFGGFPNPAVLIFKYLHRRVPPALERATTMTRTGTMRAPTMRAPTSHSLRRTGTIMSAHTHGDDARPVEYISFAAVVGRNSHFHKLTSAQEEELGGVEYRALSVLLWIVIGYYLGVQLFAVVILAPYLSAGAQFQPTFAENNNVSGTWFIFFNTWSAFSNLGMSLIDTSLVPFQDTFAVLILTGFNILAGNTALPVFLRLIIWTMSKIVPSESRLYETLRFLLDHPRRCYIYLFPAYQTWFLVFVLLVLNCTDWICFLVLDIGNQVLDQLPLNVRVIDGLIQSLCVRAAGFGVVTLSATAPALQVLYVIMMYIAVYPIALSIRSTNVYESRSMGIYEESDDEEDADAKFEQQAKTGSYIAYHARKQLAFDLWWLVLGLWLVCIIERDGIADPSSAVWFNQFTVIFEIASAYGTVGLSLGTPYSNTSLSGAFRTLSKLVLCAVMIRGRHRGLPNAIDRAVLLPSELSAIKGVGPRTSDAEGLSIRSRTRRPSMHFSHDEEEDLSDANEASSESEPDVAPPPPASPRQSARRESDTPAPGGIKFSDPFPSPTRARHLSLSEGSARPPTHREEEAQ